MVFSQDENSKFYDDQFQKPVFQTVPPRHSYYQDDYASSRYYYRNQTPDPIINNHGYYGHLDSKECRKRFGFGRVTSVIFIFVILSICFIVLVLWMLSGIQLPEFGVSSVSIPTFNVTSSSLVAEWDVDVAISNPNADLEVDFDHVMTSILFKDTILAEAPYEDFHLNPQQIIKIHSALATKEPVTPLNQEIAAGIEEERTNSGSVTFNLNIVVNAKIKSPTSLESRSIKIYCNDIKVVFSNDGTGYLTDPKAASDCLLESF